MQHVHRFILANNLLQIIFEPPKTKSSRFGGGRGKICKAIAPKATQLLLTVQVLCAPVLLSFEPHLVDTHYGFPDSQIAVYSSAQNKPLFNGHYGLNVNMELVLQHINFWKYHMVREVENTLFYAFD